MIGGAMRANAELLTAPTSEIMEPRLGMQVASKTVKKMRVLIRKFRIVPGKLTGKSD